MILFTGSGKIAETFAKKFECKIISARKLSDKDLITHIKEATAVIHNAARIYGETIDEFLSANLDLTKRIVHLIETHNPTVRCINISSMSFLKNRSSYVDISKMTDYALSKAMAEQYVNRKQLKNFCNVRFSTLFYKDKTRDGLSNLIFNAATKNEIQIYNQGEDKRDFIPLEVAVTYLFKLAKSHEIQGNVNIASGEAVSFAQVVKLLSELNPELIISNKEVTTHTILSDFSKEDVAKIAAIEYNLFDHIKEFYSACKS